MIKIKSAQEIEQMKKAGALSKMALRRVGAMVRPGVSTFELDQLAEQIIRMHGGIPAFKGYGGFPGTICASVNDQVVHGIPNPDVILRDGDIVSIDTGAIVDGWVGDNAWTFYCGTPSAEVQALCEVTRDCLKAGMVIAIEPMITLGTNHVTTGADGWVVTTNDHLAAAHYENTIAITDDGPVILTVDERGPWCSMQGGVM